MKKKRDMYIDYKRSFKNRGKRRKNKLVLALLVFLVLACLAVAIYYGVTAYREYDKDRLPKEDKKTEQESHYVEGTSDEAPRITEEPTMAPTPTLTVTTLPTTTVMEPSAAPVSSSVIHRPPVKVKGVYVTAPIAGTDYMEDLIRLVETTEINAMVIDVKDDHGKVSYLMEDTIAGEIGADSRMISDIEALITLLKEKDVYLIARIVAFKDPYLAEQRQDLAVKNKDGSLYRDNNGEGWVNPYQREVWDYLYEIAANAARKGFDEIQFDYIRFSTGKGMSEADFGEEAKIMSKEAIITEFTKYMYEKIKPLGVYLSADVYGTIISSSQDAGLVGQDYVEMAKYLDYICPMIYPSHFGKGNYGIENPDLEPYNIIRKVLTASKEKLSQIPEGEHKAIVRPWLQDFTATWVKPHMKYGGEELREQIKGVYSVEYEEWLLWNASCKYSEEGLEIE